MNIPRLRELVKAWHDGSIREAELHELRDALPEVLGTLGVLLVVRDELTAIQTELDTLPGQSALAKIKKLQAELKALLLFKARFHVMMAHAPK